LSAARHLSFLIECGNNGARLSGAFDVGDGGRLFSWHKNESKAKRKGQRTATTEAAVSAQNKSIIISFN